MQILDCWNWKLSHSLFNGFFEEERCCDDIFIFALKHSSNSGGVPCVVKLGEAALPPPLPGMNQHMHQTTAQSIK